MSSNPNIVPRPVSVIEKTVFIGLFLAGLACLFTAGILVLSAYLIG
ncbi:MAG: hypothetical protein WBV78_09155 [Roseobacter sp.]